MKSGLIYEKELWYGCTVLGSWFQPAVLRNLSTSRKQLLPEPGANEADVSLRLQERCRTAARQAWRPRSSLNTLSARRVLGALARAGYEINTWREHD